MTRRLTLDDRARAYMRDMAYITGTDPFASAFRDTVQSASEFWTWLPEDVAAERAYAFTQGCYIPANAIAIEQRTGPMVPIISYTDDLVTHIHTRLSGEHDVVCVLEHPMLLPGEGPQDVRDRLSIFEGRTYFVLDHASTVDDVSYAVWRSKQVWRMLGCIGRRPLTGVVPREIEQAFTIAYDGEGFVFASLTSNPSRKGPGCPEVECRGAFHPTS